VGNQCTKYNKIILRSEKGTQMRRFVRDDFLECMVSKLDRYKSCVYAYNNILAPVFRSLISNNFGAIYWNCETRLLKARFGISLKVTDVDTHGKLVSCACTISSRSVMSIRKRFYANIVE